MRAWSAVLMLVLAFTVVPGVSAQEAGTTWFLNDFTDPGGAGAYLSIAGPGGNAMTSTSLGTDPVELSFAEKEAGFAAGYTGGAGDGQAFAYIKSWNNLPAPATKVEFTIKAGGEVIGSGSQTKDVLNGAIVEFSITFPYEAGDLAPGTLIGMDVTVTSLGDGSPAFYPRGDDTNHWRVTLPVAGVTPVEAPGILYENLTSPMVTHTFANATTLSYVLNFSNEFPVALASFDVNGTGLVNATLIDTSGTPLFNGTATTTVVDLGNVTTGAWQLRLDYTAFNGTFSFAMLAPEAPEVGPDGLDGNATTEGGNMTEDALDADQKVPGLALPALSLALVAAAFVLRRRV